VVDVLVVDVDVVVIVVEVIVDNVDSVDDSLLPVKLVQETIKNMKNITPFSIGLLNNFL
tara:strand:- start:784 stop:960 length:177 start_codon:yes stop_codon:yes gene_type:complete